jgi:uncharacterized protein YggE
MTSKLSVCLFGMLMCVSAAFAADIPDYPFIFATGKADIATPPNIATCKLMIRAIDQDPSKAESIVDERMKYTLSTLTSKGIASSDIESFNFGKQILTNEDTEKEPATIRGYDVTRGLQFIARELASLPAIENSLVGSSNVEGIHCQFDRTDRASIEADLLTKAVHSAKDHAVRLSEPLGRHVGAAAAVSQQPFDSLAASLGLGDQLAPYRSAGLMFKKSVSADELLVPATISLSATGKRIVQNGVMSLLGIRAAPTSARGMAWMMISGPDVAPVRNGI